MNIFKRFGQWLIREDIKEFTDILHTMKDAYLDGPWMVPPSSLAAQLNQTNTPLLGEAWTSLQVDLMSQLGYTSGDSDYERTIAVQSSRRLWRYDVLTQWAIWLWTYFGFGQQISVSIDGDEVFKEFWEADRNIPILGPTKLPRLSHRLLVDGEFLWVYFTSTLDGTTTVRTVNTDNIIEIIYDEDDSATPLWYLVQLSEKTQVYVADYMYRMSCTTNNKQLDRSLINGIDADKLRPHTIVSAQHVAFNQKSMSSERGWPLVTAGAPWARTYKSFMEDRASLAAAIATFAYKAKVKGGSRGVEAIRAKFEETLGRSLTAGGTGGGYAPSRGAGGIAIENEAMQLDKMQFGTGASDAKADGEGLLTVASLGVGLFPHYAGAGDAYRLATATAMEAPLLRQWTAYQHFWTSQFRSMARYVVWAFNPSGDPVPRTSVHVTTDKLLDLDTQDLANSAAVLIRDTLIPLAGIIPPETVQRIVGSVWRLILSSFGVPNADVLTIPEAFGIETPSEVGESHSPQQVPYSCPFSDCDGQMAYSYPGHMGLLVCASCNRTFDPTVE